MGGTAQTSESVDPKIGTPVMPPGPISMLPAPVVMPAGPGLMSPGRGEIPSGPDQVHLVSLSSPMPPKPHTQPDPNGAQFGKISLFKSNVAMKFSLVPPKHYVL